MTFWKAHAYGNDFLFVPRESVSTRDASRLAQRMCDRHHGLGADGLILFERSREGGTMKLINADGSPAEISGNGLRCLAAILLTDGAPEVMTIQTDAGPKTLELQDRQASRYSFRAAMGQPEQIRQLAIPLAGETVAATAMSMGNPQCVVLEGPVDQDRLHKLGPALEKPQLFPDRTNVE
ncbi:MAG: diaminopimelate epimerase [Acidimicrobiia bacterium]